jgi:hypothetical protein
MVAVIARVVTALRQVPDDDRVQPETGQRSEQGGKADRVGILAVLGRTQVVDEPDTDREVQPEQYQPLDEEP